MLQQISKEEINTILNQKISIDKDIFKDPQPSTSYNIQGQQIITTKGIAYIKQSTDTTYNTEETNHTRKTQKNKEIFITNDKEEVTHTQSKYNKITNTSNTDKTTELQSNNNNTKNTSHTVDISLKGVINDLQSKTSLENDNTTYIQQNIPSKEKTKNPQSISFLTNNNITQTIPNITNNSNKQNTITKQQSFKNRMYINTENDMGLKQIIGGFKNFTNIVIPDNIQTILSVGGKFIIPYRTYTLEDIIDMIQDVEEIWDSTTHDNKIQNIGKWKNSLIKDMIHEKINLGKRERNIIKTITDLEDFIKSNEHVCIKEADKGKQTIILYKKEFNEMANKFMERALNDELYIYLEDDDKSKLDMRIRRETALLKLRSNKWKEKGLFKDRSPSNIGKEKEMWDKIRDVHIKIPNMQFVVKAHKKEGLGIRNICPKNKTWTYQTSAIIASLLENALIKNLNKIKYIDTNIKDIEKFALLLQNKILNKNEEIISIDIKEMFNKINKNKLMDILRRYIDNKTYNESTLMSMIEYDIQESNFAIYNHKIYKQNKGIPMGACTSSLYAKIFLDYYISLNQAELKKAGLIELYKYIDDILVICQKDKIDDIIDILKKETNLEYKVEKADEDGIEYLDLKIEITNEGKIITRKYKKDYVSNRSMNAMSAQCWNTKMATITNIFQRSMNLTSKERLYDVIQNDIEIITNNGYTLKCIEKALTKTFFKYKDMVKKSPTDNNTEEKIKILKENIAAINMQRKQLTRMKRNNLRYNTNQTSKTNDKSNQIRRRKMTPKIIKKYKKYKDDHNRINITKYIRTPFLSNTATKKVKAKIQDALKQNQKFAVKANKERRMSNIIAKKEK